MVAGCLLQRGSPLRAAGRGQAAELRVACPVPQTLHGFFYSGNNRPVLLFPSFLPDATGKV